MDGKVEPSVLESPYPMRTSSSTTAVPGRRRAAITAPWWFVVPAAAAFVFVVVVPSAQAIFYSFTNWDGFTSVFEMVGLENYRSALENPNALRALRNTIALTVLVTALQMVLALALALALNSQVKSRNALRVLFFSPVVLTSVAVGYIWQFMLKPTGVLNQLLSFVGLGSLRHDWLGDPSVNLWAIGGITVWQSVGFTMVIYLAGLQSVPAEIIEAAYLDGAGPWQRFWYVIRPSIAPATLINSVLCVVGGLKLFDVVFITTAGGPAYSSTTLATLTYTDGFVPGNYTLGVTLSVLLSLLVTLVAIVQFRLLRSRDAA
ncbi:carbohydrate ABC transporter permease [Streptomyces sp. NPDC058656]|uniref:carbohydrate ABC transporter permease n=1 Tax=unclassified Streptomyces TaxID=2593676 RepID=UPI00366991DE